jgi:hypothetical protein
LATKANVLRSTCLFVDCGFDRAEAEAFCVVRVAIGEASTNLSVADLRRADTRGAHHTTASAIEWVG